MWARPCDFSDRSYNQKAMLSILLHFYQPSTQLPEVFRDVVKSCYTPLIKVIKNNKKLNLTANMPLALLEQLDKFAYRELLGDIRLLVEQGRLELTGTGAYHPLLTKLPEGMVQRQAILNEFAYAYYFGVDKDFEGEQCYMIKDVRGFFPPEMALDTNLVRSLSALGYEWVLADEFSLPEEARKKHKNGVRYAIGGCSAKVLIRNRGLSNLLAFNRSFDVSMVAKDLLVNGEGAILALDAETFGHHYKDGVSFFDNLALELEKGGMDFLTISQAFRHLEEKSIPEILESTWSTVDDDVYSMWVNKESPANAALWDLFHAMHNAPEVLDIFAKSEEPYLKQKQNAAGSLLPVPLWKESASPSREDRLMLNLVRSEQSDAFWWSTGAKVGGKTNISKHMILSVLDYYRGVLSVLGSASGLIEEKIANVEKSAEFLF